MKNTARFLFALTLACALGATQGTVAAQDKLQGAGLEKAVAGKVVYMSTEGGTVPIHYKADRTMTGKLQSMKAMLAVSTPKRDSGTWWINADRLCQRWSRWLDNKTHCYKLQRDGDNVLWERNDGRKGRARLGK